MKGSVSVALAAMLFFYEGLTCSSGEQPKKNLCDFPFTALTREKLIESMLAKSLVKPFAFNNQQFSVLRFKEIRVHSCQSEFFPRHACVADIVGLSQRVRTRDGSIYTEHHNRTLSIGISLLLNEMPYKAFARIQPTNSQIKVKSQCLTSEAQALCSEEEILWMKVFLLAKESNCEVPNFEKFS